MMTDKFCIRRRRVGAAVSAGVALFLLFGGGGAAAQTADTVQTWRHEGTTVTFSGGTLRVSGKGDMANYVLGSPWHTVAATDAVIEEGITRIGSKAFMMMYGLKSVSIPNSVTSIEGESFRETALTSIDIPSGVKFIRATGVEGAFDGCARLISINVAADNAEYSSEDGVLFNKDKSYLILYPMGRSGAYKIPSGVRVIGNRAFAVNKNITSITIPGSVETISSEAFAGCDSLNYVMIEDGVKNIRDLAFWGCDGLRRVVIPNSVTSISPRAFAGCTGLLSITVSDDNPNYSSEDGALFNKNKTVLIQYPDGRHNVSDTNPDIARNIAIALGVLTALISFAAILAIIKKTRGASVRRRAVFIGTAAALSALALFAVYMYYLDAVTFSITIKANPPKSGIVTSEQIGRFGFVLTARPSDGYIFTGWSGASTLIINPLTITLTGDDVLTANFKKFEPRSVQIGNRRWMAENLNIITGRSWCYDNDESNCQKYGRLYDYKTALEACPPEWRLPSKDDWNSLIRAGGYKTGVKLKSKTGWPDKKCVNYRRYNSDEETNCEDGSSGNGTDEFGFSALPGGEGSENRFNGIGLFGEWWTDKNDELYVLDYFKSDEFGSVYTIAGGTGSDGSSIRCVQDIPGVPEKPAVSNGPPPDTVKSWKSGAITATYYADGMLRVSGNGRIEDCYPPWVEYRRVPSVEDCGSPWRFYQVAYLIIEDGVTHIGSHAFDGCHIMSYVAIPSSVASIGIEAFHYCTSLRSIVIRNPNPPRFGSMRKRLDGSVSESASASDIFDSYHEDIMNKACLYVPANSVDAYRAANGWKDFSCIKEIESAPKGY
ncbi:hypothetical protein R80B4_02044 [Fibrobacteres bacterium R8-0-B4]